MADRLGQQLGNYRLIQLLGRGGFAEVYLGEHVRLKTQAAIKVLHTQLASQEEENFLKEAQVVAHLEHPHIVRILDFDVANGVPFLVMSYAPNGTLRQRYQIGIPLPLPTIISYVSQIAGAVQYAHDEKVIHRDIKPENMLLGRHNEIILSDFGIATMVQSSRYQSTQNMVGTVAYMAPEQIQGKPRPASDQYSLAVVVYEWLSGHRPFQGSFTEIATQHIFTPPPSLREKISTIPPSIEYVVMTALEKELHKRFASIKAFATALEQASQEDISSPTGAVQPSLPDARPTPVVSIPVRVTKPSFFPTVISVPYEASNLPTGTLLCTYRGHVGAVEGVTWSPDSTYIASASDDGTVQVWEAITGKHILTYRGHTQYVTAVAWSPDGSCIASGGGDQTVQVWEAMTGNHLLTYRGHTEGIFSLAWSPDGSCIASASDDQTVHVWDMQSGKEIFTCSGLDDSVWVVAWSPDNEYLAFQNNNTEIQVCDSLNGHKVRTYRGHTDSVWAIAWSLDGTYIASGGDDKVVQVWKAKGRKIFTYKGHSDSISAITWSPDADGTYIASASEDHTVQVWASVTGNEVVTYKGHSNCVSAVAWSPDGAYIASGSLDQTVQVWTAPSILIS